MRLLYSVPCQRAITDKGDNTVSLVATFTGFHLDLPEGMNIPEAFVMPMAWTLVNCWQREESEINKSYEQKVDILLPNDAVFGETVSAIEFESAVYHSHVNGAVFPASREGVHHIRTSVRESDVEEWYEVFRAPIKMNIHWKTLPDFMSVRAANSKTFEPESDPNDLD